MGTRVVRIWGLNNIEICFQNPKPNAFGQREEPMQTQTLRNQKHNDHAARQQVWTVSHLQCSRCAIGYSQAVSTLLSASPLPFLDVNKAKTHPEKKNLRSIDNFTSFVTQFSLAIFGFPARCMLASVAHRTMGRSQPVVNLVPFLLFSLLPLWTFYQEDLLTGTVVSQRMTSRCSGLHQSH